MLLTKKYLKEYQESMRIYIPDNIAKELLDTYGTYVIDDDGHMHDYTEQDISEQLRKILRDKGCTL